MKEIYQQTAEEDLQNTFFLSFCKLIPSALLSGPSDLFIGKP